MNSTEINFKMISCQRVDGDQHRMHVQNVDDHVDQQVKTAWAKTEHQHEEERTWLETSCILTYFST